MFLSKFILPALCLFTVVPFSVASPTPAPEPRADLEIRQIPSVLSIVTQLQTTAAPIMTSLTGAAGNAAQVQSLMGQLTTAVTSAAGGVSSNTSIPAADVTPIVLSLVGLIVQLVTTLLAVIAGSLLGGPVGGIAGLDTALATLLSALAVLNPGILGSIGSGLPLGTSGLLSVVGLLSTAGLL